MGIRFCNLALLERAFIHRSFLNELLDDNAELVDNERLEFLGDTVLGYLVSERLYHIFPEQQEGDLTNLRSALVRREILARMAQELDLSSHLKLGHGEEESGGRTRPATLCAVFEALIGAIYLDLGTDTTKMSSSVCSPPTLSGGKPPRTPRIPRAGCRNRSKRTKA